MRNKFEVAALCASCAHQTILSDSSVGNLRSKFGRGGFLPREPDKAMCIRDTSDSAGNFHVVLHAQSTQSQEYLFVRDIFGAYKLCRGPW